MLNFIFIFTLFVFSSPVHSKIYTRCGLARELLAQKFPCDLLSNWVCLVEAESARNTSALGILNGKDKFYRGLFQINEEYWCRKGVAGGGCNVTCESLITDDITSAATCAMKMYNARGFNQWAGWKVRCEGKKHHLSECFDEGCSDKLYVS